MEDGHFWDDFWVFWVSSTCDTLTFCLWAVVGLFWRFEIFEEIELDLAVLVFGLVIEVVVVLFVVLFVGFVVDGLFNCLFLLGFRWLGFL